MAARGYAHHLDRRRRPRRRLRREYPCQQELDVLRFLTRARAAEALIHEPTAENTSIRIAFQYPHQAAAVATFVSQQAA